MADPEREYLPRVYRDLRAEHPGVAAAYDALGHACRTAGPLSERDQRLVKLGIAIGLSSEGAVRSHIRRGLDEGLIPVGPRHVRRQALRGGLIHEYHGAAA
jgi:alkylhydroperoxidase/carboxymuconolactone decarboxylase family protein YurZ